MSAHFFTLQCTETPEQVASEPPTSNSSQIAAFVGEEMKQYFVIVEQRVLCQVPSFQLSLFISFSAHYVFHLQYPKPIKNVMFFLQDYVLAIPDSLRRPATYLATASDIKKNWLTNVYQWLCQLYSHYFVLFSNNCISG